MIKQTILNMLKNAAKETAFHTANTPEQKRIKSILSDFYFNIVFKRHVPFENLKNSTYINLVATFAQVI